jgi:DNA-binding NtrC family response regulator
MDLSPSSLTATFLNDLEGGSLLIKDLECLPASVIQMLPACMDGHPTVSWMGTCRAPHDLPEKLRQRIGVVEFVLDPLEERMEDILPLFRLHLAYVCQQSGRTPPMVGRQIEKGLLNRKWLGNIGELVWIVTEATRACQGAVLRELPAWSSPENQSMLLPCPRKDSLAKMLQSVASSAERHFLEEAISMANGDLTRAAESLGLATKNFVHKLKDYGIS